MWQCQVLDFLCQQFLDNALQEELEDMNDKEWGRINCQTCSYFFCLTKASKYVIMKETFAKILQKTMKDMYMIKSFKD